MLQNYDVMSMTNESERLGGPRPDTATKHAVLCNCARLISGTRWLAPPVSVGKSLLYQLEQLNAIEPLRLAGGARIDNRDDPARAGNAIGQYLPGDTDDV